MKAKTYLYTSDAYGSEPFEDTFGSMKEGLEGCFDGLSLSEGYSLCDCGEFTDTIVDQDGVIIAIEPEHFSHQPW